MFELLADLMREAKTLNAIVREAETLVGVGGR